MVADYVAVRREATEVRFGEGIDIPSLLDHLSDRAVEVRRVDIVARFVLLFDKAGVNEPVVSVVTKTIHQRGDMIGKERVVIVEYTEEVPGQRFQTCPPSGTAVPVVGNDDAPNPAEARPKFIDDIVKPGYWVELNQKHGYFLISLSRQAAEGAGYCLRWSRSDANNVFNQWLRIFFRPFYSDHVAALLNLVDEFGKGSQHVFKAKMLSEEFV